MKKRIFAAAITAMALTLGCTASPTAVRGFESQRGAGGWTAAESGAAAESSDVLYLGASADGKIIVRRADGRVEIWGRN
jgi:hypothetical protein